MKKRELPHELKMCVFLLIDELGKRKIEYKGDMSDFGNEVGYCLGQVIENIKNTEISDFITGLRHGISLTNGTH